MSTTTHATRSDVKASLTPNRRGRVVENDQYTGFVRRVIAAYSRRVAAGDIDAITGMTSIATELDDAITEAVTGLRAAGYSWADIAARLGLTRQAAQQRWGKVGRPRIPPRPHQIRGDHLGTTRRAWDRTTRRWPNVMSHRLNAAELQSRLPYRPGSQGVAGSNPAVPTGQTGFWI
jgi:hypothetical protein